MKKIFLVLLANIMFLGCAGESKEAPSLSGATRCEVKFLNLAASSDELWKEITLPSEISSLATFADKQILSASSWCHLSRVGDRSAHLKVSFYNRDEYKGTLGLGIYDREKFFLKYHYFGISKVICISNEEKNEFLKLVGMSQEEYASIFSKI